jgi:hypothetical protein
MRRDTIQSLIREHGPEGFGDMFERLLTGRGLPSGVKKIDPKSISIRALWEGCVGPVEDTLGPNMARTIREAGGALDYTAFPTATEKLLATVSIKAYEDIPGIGDRLVTEEMTPKTLTERIEGFTTGEAPKPLAPGEEYPTVGFAEKFATFEEALFNRKEGLEIQVTEEVLRFDQTNMILNRARQAGNTLGKERERRTVRAVLGIGSDLGTTIGGVYYPSGVDTPLYRASIFNYRTDAVPIYNFPGVSSNDSKLRDYTDIAEIMTIHAQKMVDDRVLGTQRPISWSPDTILVPYSLAVIAGQIFASQGVVFITNSGDTTHNEVRNSVNNPLSALFGGGAPSILSSPYVDEVTQTGWVMFDKASTFVRVVIFPFQTFQAPDNYGWNRDVVFALRVREWSRVVALDAVHAIYSAGA